MHARSPESVSGSAIVTLGWQGLPTQLPLHSAAICLRELQTGP